MSATSVGDWKPAPYNPRKISDPALAALGKALREYGDLGGIVFNTRTSRLVGGHQRIKHLKPDWVVHKEPTKDGTGTVARGWVDTPWGRLDYREVDWTEQKEKAANIAANKHGGEFAIPQLKELLVELNDGSFPLELTGFMESELKEMIDYEGQQGLTDPDDVPLLPDKAVTNPGDLWIRGPPRQHRSPLQHKIRSIWSSCG